jgi:hypothetical protein
MICEIDGVRHLALISCHFDDTFSYFDGEKWIRKARTVPRDILNDPQLPECERLRVRSRLAEAGVSPS